MQIAIIGAGFSGLAAAWHLLNTSFPQSIQCTLFDANGIGGGASGIAAGLMHPYAGAHAKLNWKGKEGCLATLKLIEAASLELGSPVASTTGLLRIAISNEQLLDYQRCAEKYPDVLWKTPQECQELVPGVVEKPGIFIPSAVTVDCPLYLQGLWKSCAKRGAQFKKRSVHNLQELDAYDLILITMGFDSKSLLPELPLGAVRGQVLELKWPDGIPPLAIPLNSHAYVIMNKERKSCIVGATYERDFDALELGIEHAIKELMPKVEMLFPALKNAPILDCKTGIRASTPDHLPIAKRIDKKVWTLTGMGSKGLLYHALYAEQLVKTLIATL